MRVTYDSQKDHWAIGQQYTCDRCTSRFVIETTQDFYDQYNSNSIRVKCPCCRRVNEYYRPKEVQPWKPAGTTTVTWQSVVEDVKTHNLPSTYNFNSLAAQMEDAETQDEYFGK